MQWTFRILVRAFPAAVCALLSLGAATPQELRCGQVLTKSTVLSRNLYCQGTALYIGAHGITVDLKGYTVSGDGTGVGIRNDGILPTGYNGTGGYDGVLIRGGTLQHFDAGVVLATTSSNTITNMIIRRMKRNPFGTGVVLTVANDRARVRFNLIEDNDRGGISVDGFGCSERSGDSKPVCIDNRIEENKIYDNARAIGSDVYYGLQLFLARGVVANKNEIYGHLDTQSEGVNAAGILIVGSSQNYFSENKLENNSHGLLLTDEFLAAGAVSRANTLFKNFGKFNRLQAFEFRPAATATARIEENLADDNYGSGFLFLYRGASNASPDFSGFSLYKNDAQGGGRWGFAAISTVDGVLPVPPKNLGENVASSNGASPQCLGFRCTD